ncbi:protein-L-isoaspartate O-methyltransferase family protein [Dongia deserti]|uniref:protein-L-isoaspartate O-methyltransferase family protein n=1 Tax=Dongia deserti TaxID=2268030 RepID=UPI0013C48D48|nr:rRNA adenine N-6-methyltransferase family protein [Dongia deserti]
MPGDPLASTRRRFAEEIAKQRKITDQRLIDAFANVPREDFLGPGPWHVLDNTPDYVVTASDDPALVYVNAPIALDAARRINNGEPALHIGLLAQLAPQAGDYVVQVGVGGGYYTAIIARLIGPSGRVTAIEYDAALAQRATANLAGERNVEVIHADGTSYDFDPADGIYVNAGATQPSPLWLDKLKPSGRLIMVLTAADRWGRILKVQRADIGYAAALLGPCGIIPCINGRDAASEAAFAAALATGGIGDVRSLRRDAHDADDTCWMHCDGFCLSRLEVE